MPIASSCGLALFVIAVVTVTRADRLLAGKAGGALARDDATPQQLMRNMQDVAKVEPEMDAECTLPEPIVDLFEKICVVCQSMYEKEQVAIGVMCRCVPASSDTDDWSNLVSHQCKPQSQKSVDFLPAMSGCLRT